MFCKLKKCVSGLFLDQNFKNSDFFDIFQILIQELDRIMTKYWSFVFLCLLLCFVHDMDTIGVDLGKCRSLNSTNLYYPFKVPAPVGTGKISKMVKSQIYQKIESHCHTGTSRECLKNIQKALLSVSYHQPSQFVVHIRPNIDFPKTRTFPIHFWST